MPADPDRTSIRASIRRPARAAFAVALLGLAIAAYLTFEHYDASAALACPESATINCAKVTSSRWSEVAGVPVALLGLLYFLGLSVLTAPSAWRWGQLDVVRVGAVTVGAVTVLYLVYVELFRIDAICLWCTGVHVCVIVVFALVLWLTSVVRDQDAVG